MAERPINIVDPQVPAEDRAPLEQTPPDRLPPPGAVRAGRPAWAPWSDRTVVLLAVPPAFLGLMVLRWMALGVSWLFSSSGWGSDFIGFILLLITFAVGAGLVWGGIMLAEELREPERLRRRLHYAGFLAAQRHPGRFHVPARMHADDHRLLQRALSAAHSALGSEAYRTRALDAVHGRVEMPERLWRLAEDLHALRPHLQQFEQARQQVVTRAGKEALRRTATAHREGWRALERRVEHIERYAARVAELDRVLGETSALLRLAGRQDDLLTLLSRLAEGPLDAAQSAALDQDVEAALKTAVQEARDAASLLMPE